MGPVPAPPPTAGDRAEGAGGAGWHQRDGSTPWNPGAGDAPKTAAAAAPAIAATAPAAAPTAAAATSAGARVVRSGVPDDLKRIKGIGVVLEKKLHGLGVINYGQIAGWSQGDIDKMSEVLDFKGRIERENWIEQARILASGGITDFARRVDRGEVETSKPRPIR